MELTLNTGGVNILVDELESKVINHIIKIMEMNC